MVTVSIRSYFSAQYLWSAQRHARDAAEAEEFWTGKSVFSISHRAHVMDAVNATVAFAEAVVNELFQDAADGLTNNFPELHDEVISRLAAFWIAGEQAGTLRKYDAALQIAGHQNLDMGAEPAQSMSTVIALRNFLVHYKPESVGPTLEPSRLALRLQRARFTENALMAGAGNAWFPDKALGAGCAAWAVDAAFDFVEGWATSMGLKKLSYKIANWEESP